MTKAERTQLGTPNSRASGPRFLQHCTRPSRESHRTSRLRRLFRSNLTPRVSRPKLAAHRLKFGPIRGKLTQSYETDGWRPGWFFSTLHSAAAAGVYLDRTAGCDRDHRHPGRAAVAGARQGQGESGADSVRQQFKQWGIAVSMYAGDNREAFPNNATSDGAN